MIKANPPSATIVKYNCGFEIGFVGAMVGVRVGLTLSAPRNCTETATPAVADNLVERSVVLAIALVRLSEDTVAVVPDMRTHTCSAEDKARVRH